MPSNDNFTDRQIAIDRDTARLREIQLLATFSAKYREDHCADGAGDLGVLADVECRILSLAEAVVG